jgi:hypothetical protein
VIASIFPSAPGFPLTVPINSSGFGYFLATLPTVGNYTISVAPELSKLFLTGTAPPVTVVPGPAARMRFLVQPANTPTGDVLPPLSVQILDLSGNVVTTDNTDTVTISVASGPGALTAGSTLTAAVRNGVATFSNLVLTAPGIYTLSAVVPSYFIAASAPFTVLPLQVVPASFTSTPSGFALQFNAAFLVNSVTPVLYGSGFGRAAPVPSVTLTGPSGPVPGSLVVNPATNSLTFVATNTASMVDSGTPILPDGTYTAVIHGSAATNGIEALNSGGGYLDGLGTGVAGSGDFVATLTISAAAEDVLWVPATADGPGQPLNAPGNNQVGGGYPVYLSDSTGAVTSVVVTLNYNPALLGVTGVTGPGFSLLATSTPGHAILQYSGPEIPKGSQVPIGYLTASVPGGTFAAPVPYRAKDLLHLSGALLNGGAIPVVTSDALHLVAYVGDGDGNGSYSSNDAALITRAALQIDSGFAAYPLVDPVIVADSDGTGYIAADAGLQANEAGVNFPTANLPSPPVPPGVQFQPIANNVDPVVSIPGDLHAGADGTLTVPVNIDDAHPAGSTGLMEARLALTYDPRLFTVSAADVHPGSVLAAGSGWTVVSTIDLATGQIGIALSSTTPIAQPIGGSLVTIDFHQQAAASGPATIALVASVNPDGQYFATELADAQGTFTLTPTPTNDVAGRIQGTVMLAAAPSASVVSPAAPSLDTLVVTAPLEIRASEGHAPDLAEPETANSTAAIPEGNELDPVARMAEVVYVNLNAAIPAVARAAGRAENLQAAVPLTSGPVISTLSVNAPTSMEGATGQHLTDQLFQSLVRGNGPSNPPLMRSLLAQPQLDAFDALNGDETVAGLDWDGISESLALQGMRRRRGARINRPVLPAAISPATIADGAALDLYFAQSADISDQTVNDE